MRAIQTPFRLVFLLSTLLLVLPPSVRADDWPQWLGPKRDAIWRETGIVDKFPQGGPKVRWRTPIGAGYSGPAVAKGRVYVTDHLLAEDAENPADNPFNPNVRIAGKERILCLDEKTGELLWKHEYDRTYRISYADGPRATPLVHEGRVYTLGAMGNLLCLDAAKGTVIWSKDFVADCKAPVPLWGFAAHPLLDGDKLICLVGGKDHIVVAFDKNTGAEKWHALSFKNRSTQIGYCPPMIYTIGGKRQLIIWHPEAVNGLDPESGELYWSQPFSVGANLSVPTPRQAGDLLFLTSFYNGAMMLKFTDGKPAVLWRSKVKSEFAERTDTLNSIIPTPFLRDGYIYGVCSYGELRCLRQRRQTHMDEPQGDGGCRRDSALGQRFSDCPGRSLFLAQREGRSSHRPADAEGLRGNRSRSHPRSDGSFAGAISGMVASGLRQQVDVCAQRQGNRVRLSRGSVILFRQSTAQARETRTLACAF